MSIPVEGARLEYSLMQDRSLLLLAISLCISLCYGALAHAQDATAMQRIDKGSSRFDIDRTEVSIGDFRRYVQATGAVTQAEREGGGSTFEAGWERRAAWVWHSPFGKPGADKEPATHVTYPEAEAYCRWAGKRLPLDVEWGQAAYVEQRQQPPTGFVRGKTYAYPTGDSPQGANCLGDCGNTAVAPGAITSRGRGHALTGSTRAGVNGLFEMGGNLWEWVDSGPGTDKRTRGGSWWYGAGPMQDSHVQSKPQNTAVIYIGFRCARDAPYAEPASGLPVAR